MLTSTQDFDKPMVTENFPKILSGDGLSSETAVKFEPCRLADRVAAERRFVSSSYGAENIHWTEWMHFTSMDFQSVWSIKLADGTERSVFFEAIGTIYEEE